MKKSISKVMAVTLAMALVVSGLVASPASVSAAKTKAVKVTQVKATPTSIKLCIGQTKVIKTTVKPGTATNKKVTYTTSNKKVATVTKAGKVTAVSAGKAVITAKAASNSKKVSKVTVTVYKNVTITNANVKNGVATLAAGTYGNVTISKTVDKAKVVVNGVTVKGTLSLESGAAYTVEAGKSTINKLKVVSSTAVTAQAVEDAASVPSFVVLAGTKVAAVSLQAAASIDATAGTVGTISVQPSNNTDLAVAIKGFNGALEVAKAAKSNVTISVANSTIKSASVAGGAADQTVKFASTDASKIVSVLVAGTVKLTVGVAADSVTVAKTAAGASLVVDKPVTTITNEGASTALTVNAKVGTVNSTGEKATIEVTKDASIGTVTAAGAATKITGAGSIATVNVTAKDVAITATVTTVTVAKDATGVTVGGKAVEPGTTTTTTATTPGTTVTPGTPSTTPTTSSAITATTSSAITVRPSKVVVTFENGKKFTQSVTGSAIDTLIKSVVVGTKYEDKDSNIFATVKVVSATTYEVELTGAVKGTYTLTYTYDKAIKKANVTVSYDTSKSEKIAKIEF